MSSIVNTLLQYFLIVSVAYLYAKMPWTNKKTGSSPMGRALGKLHASGLAEYYTEETKKERPVRKHKIIEKEVAKPEPTTDDQKNHSVRASTRVKAQQSLKQSPPSTEATPKKQSKRSSSGSPTRSKSGKQDQVAKQQQPTTPGKLLSPTTKSSLTPDHSSGHVPTIPTEEAARHHRFLSEMFKDVPMSEIEQALRTAHWDVDEAASMLAQEDYTWQHVRRRRSVPSVDAA
ncbi:hypothetical protein BGZ51_002114 [Haplosporangium sp. Z 767]|nr:hypothetical protein BGZ51_002114 [Haplosporangium sp. Z 767]KAF9187302.1 hypothetical protein BGZ50_002014 [Haplosporangium sp. Z 11]